jgi:hypothetical protein
MNTEILYRDRPLTLHRWVDADSMILNPALSPCLFLPPKHLENIYALVTADHNGLNNGVFYLRVHSSSVDLLTRTINYPLAHPEDDLGWFGEQAAMAKVIKSIEAEHQDPTNPSGIAWIPRTWINNFEWERGFEGEPGSFMVHLLVWARRGWHIWRRGWTSCSVIRRSGRSLSPTLH